MRSWEEEEDESPQSFIAAAAAIFFLQQRRRLNLFLAQGRQGADQCRRIIHVRRLRLLRTLQCAQGQLRTTTQ